ncbi:MAG: U32 family peptidase, partial [Proteobacteria bacterium]|nr:U32 family peptidase [Pseudomonadota bacterium]
TQTLSYTWCNLAGELAELRAMGVHRFRLSPQDTDMVAVARIFRDLLDGRRQPREARESLAGLAGGTPFSNGFYYGMEGIAFREPVGPVS